ncbi:MAG: NADP-dependent isocitrate dehydrogenase [Saprospiraceae bacterium]|nr:NADP-dependent isocitrate dehydrogenase [Saprospiraceae bacterium]
MSTGLLYREISKTKSEKAVKIAVSQGDGIGPEIMQATLNILQAAGANIEPEFIDLGQKVYLAGNSAGIDSEAWDIIKRNKVILKAPISTPQGKGYKSLNVTLRKSLGLFANVRPVAALDPFISTGHRNMDVVIIRENEEDLYAGIEHQQTSDVVQCLKLITRPGCERIIRYAFEYARVYRRKKVTCMLKDNIMKLTDGLFHRVFDEIAQEYPEIKSETQIIDIGAAKLAANPENYDVVVTSNLYGDIISDIVAEIAGSVGLAGSANIGREAAMFEAIHGSAPDIAGFNIANPSGLINAAVMMLAHIGQNEIADKVRNAWLATIEDGYHTADIFKEGRSKKCVNTQEFADEVIRRLGDVPRVLEVSHLGNGTGKIRMKEYQRPKMHKSLVGTDVFLDWQGSDPNELGSKLANLDTPGIKLKMITNRGVKVYPGGMDQTYCTDHWRCRFVSREANTSTSGLSYPGISYLQVLSLLTKLVIDGYDIIKTENLYEFDGQPAFSLGQGE